MKTKWIRQAGAWSAGWVAVSMAWAGPGDWLAREAAVQRTLAQAPACQNLGDYYWEIGDARGALLRGQHGYSIRQEKVIHLASASKWVFGAYVAQREGGRLSLSEVAALEMLSGYDELQPLLCKGSETGRACFARGDNNGFNPEHVGKFSYNGGHDQKLLIDLGLGDIDNAALTTELQARLGADVDIRFNTPEPAGGMAAAPAAYAHFLRKIMRGELVINRLLGAHPVCTLPGSCANAVQSPSPYAWHYSLNHWVEDDPKGDGAFSSAGAFGFYPWISADKALYGIFARQSYLPDAGMKSAECGALVRKAFVSAGSGPIPLSSSLR